jgi:hypothetical protein
MIRYVRIAKDDGPLRARLEELASERRRFGFRRLAVLIRRAGWIVNIKCVLRVYREANLQVRKRLKRRVALGPERRRPSLARLMSVGRSTLFMTALKPAVESERSTSWMFIPANAWQSKSTLPFQVAALLACSMRSAQFEDPLKPS